jgi:hypothetical protein
LLSNYNNGETWLAVNKGKITMKSPKSWKLNNTLQNDPSNTSNKIKNKFKWRKWKHKIIKLVRESQNSGIEEDP